VTVTVSQSANWAITSLVDQRTGLETLGPQGAGSLVFYQDRGNIYRFGNEMPNCGWQLESDPKITALPLLPGAIVSGPAYISISTAVVCSNHLIVGGWQLIAHCKQNVVLGDVTYQYTRTYSLGATDKAVKVEVTGASPAYYSVFTRVGYRAGVTTLQYGTPLHWDSVQPTPYWSGLTFMSIHHFLRLGNQSTTFGHIYSAEMRAWAIDSDQSLLGGLFRNTPGGGCEGYGADGTDSLTNTVV